MSRATCVLALSTIVLAAVPDARSQVRIREGLTTASGLQLLRTDERVVHVVRNPGTPAARAGRLPRHCSALAVRGDTAWGMTLGRQRSDELRLTRIGARTATLDRLPVAVGGRRRVSIDAAIGVDDQHLYLAPGLRVHLEDRRLEQGHLDAHPELELLDIASRDGLPVYLAREAAAETGKAGETAEAGKVGETDDGGERKARLWLLQRAEFEPEGIRYLQVEAGPAEGEVRLEEDGENVFLVRPDRILRYSRADLRLAEDLSPMIAEGEVAFFAADDDSYWLQTDADARGAGGQLWQMDREVLDGAPFVAERLPEDFAPLGQDAERLWFGAAGGRERRPVASVAKAGGSLEEYRIRSQTTRGWRRFGRGALRTVTLAPIAVVGGVLAVAAAPIGVSMTLANEASARADLRRQQRARVIAEGTALRTASGDPTVEPAPMPTATPAAGAPEAAEIAVDSEPAIPPGAGAR